MILATTIHLFDNLSQYTYNDNYVDFHNTTTLERILFFDKVLMLKFKHNTSGKFLSLKFTDVRMSQIDYFNSEGVKGLTIDNLYRGRFENKGTLKDISEDGRAYFYLETYEGQKMEFWAKEIGIEEEMSS
ncbi:MAG: hypothetical protein LUF85_09350 [Bacteroides sp.]|nr:hypothetical protein [Bacteroides sp.]